MHKVVLIGASGKVGSRIARELSDRGHQVTAIARHPANVEDLPGITAVHGDVTDAGTLPSLLAGHDAVVSALRFLGTDFQALVDAIRASGVRRYLVVGGAGSLEVAPGKRVIDQPDFPAAYKEESAAGVEFLGLLRTVDDLDWTFVSPSALFSPGERTGVFRLGGDRLLTNSNGSSISYEDFAVALVDEIETPRHIRRRFTVGY